MSAADKTLAHVAPDRLFDRATGIVIGVGLAMILAANLAVDRAVQRQGTTALLAHAAVEEAAIARAVVETLGHLAVLEPGPEQRTARTKLAWDVERLVDSTRSRQRVARTAGEDVAGTLEASEQALALSRRTAIDGYAAERLQILFESQILPRLDRAAATMADAAGQARGLARLVIAGSFAAQLLGLVALFFAVVRPARERIAAWVAASNESDREHRFRLLHDSLTRMPNGTYLHAYLSRVAIGAARRPGQTAVLRVELDRFGLLRETLGQRRCDEIIRIAARRVQTALRSGDFAAHLGDGNFVIVAGDLVDANASSHIVARIQQALLLPFSIHGGARRITCSIGLTLLSDDDETDPDLVLGNASIALAEAKSAGAGHIRYFREDLRIEMEQREQLYTELANGLETGEIVTHFQPQIDLATGGFCGFEALVRWNHPLRGPLPPAAFVDFADETDLAERIGELVLARSLEAMKGWEAACLEVPTVGVNFALAQLRDPRLIEKIKWETERHDIDPTRVSIEVRETVLNKSDAETVVRNLRGLASSGFGIELDDFGTGHASIANLRRFMVDRIKIDQSFLSGINESEEQQQLTASMIAMAHALGIKTLAEGVETEAAEAKLRELGCDYLQGFLVAEAMPFEETLDWLRGFEPRRYATAGH